MPEIGFRRREVDQKGRFRLLFWGLFLTFFYLYGAGVPSAQVEVAVPGQGKVTTSVKVENGVLGITNTYVRQRAFAKECIGACFYASTTKTKTWVCRNSDCNLDCSGREPVGGC